MLSFPIHNVQDISIRHRILNNIRCITIDVVSSEGKLELELYGKYPYPVIAAEKDIPIVPLENEDN